MLPSLCFDLCCSSPLLWVWSHVVAVGVVVVVVVSCFLLLVVVVPLQTAKHLNYANRMLPLLLVLMVLLVLFGLQAERIMPYRSPTGATNWDYRPRGVTS